MKSILVLALVPTAMLVLQGCVPLDPFAEKRIQEIEQEKEELRGELRAVAQDRSCTETEQCRTILYGGCTQEETDYSTYHADEALILQKARRMDELDREESQLGITRYCPLYDRIPPTFACTSGQCTTLPPNPGSGVPTQPPTVPGPGLPQPGARK
jgi:hypothetical protein